RTRPGGLVAVIGEEEAEPRALGDCGEPLGGEVGQTEPARDNRSEGGRAIRADLFDAKRRLDLRRRLDAAAELHPRVSGLEAALGEAGSEVGRRERTDADRVLRAAGTEE